MIGVAYFILFTACTVHNAHVKHFCLGTGLLRLCAGFGTVDCSRVQTRIQVRGWMCGSMVSTVFHYAIYGLFEHNYNHRY